VKEESSVVVKVKEESTAGKKRKSRGSLDIGENSNKMLINKHILIRAVDTEPNPPARRSLRNKPKQHEGSHSSSVVPLASIGSTPDPSPNDTLMEEWGTSVPSGAFFKSNLKYFVDKVDEGEDEEDDEDNEGEREDDEATEDDEARGNGEDGEDGNEEDEEEGTSDAEYSDKSIVV
jgi:hypothetical protein